MKTDDRARLSVCVTDVKLDRSSEDLLIRVCVSSGYLLRLPVNVDITTYNTRTY